MSLAKAMFQHVWEARRAQAKEIITSGKRDIKRLKTEIESVLDRIMSASNDTIIRRYESKVETLESQKALLVETLAKQAEPKGSSEEKLEPALNFLSNPWKLWDGGTVQARRLVLKLAFTGPIKYTRKKGARNAYFSFLFDALHEISTG
ncbi:hypothetical protein [Epibacterium ulvae]|uniref:hypothetical protein n=1 Tax=Epibacterium ulvae TaxID=1156985 RepID=UPI00249263C1|nr:hypothetical protein [Epibacterium ulvae]